MARVQIGSGERKLAWTGYIEQEYFPKTLCNKLDVFLNSLRKPLLFEIQKQLVLLGAIKALLVLQVHYEKRINLPIAPTDDKNIYFVTEFVTIYPVTPIDPVLHNWFKYLKDRNDAFEEGPSDTTAYSIPKASLIIAQYPILKRGSGYVPLPSRLLKCGGVVSVHNQNDYCFAYAVWTALHPNLKRRISLRQMKNIINDPMFSNLCYPISPSEVPQLQHILGIKIGR
jgi:hypothetical protein